MGKMVGKIIEVVHISHIIDGKKIELCIKNFKGEF